MLVHFTVAIPTYNGASRLSQVLECLRQCCTDSSIRQLNLSDFCCEVIVVDNNSTDNTAAVVQAYQANWPGNSELRYCFEPRQGAAFARQKAVEEARGELIGFLDDDNLPEKDWIASAIAFGQAHPQAGAYGSQIHAKFDREPPQDFARIACFLAIVERGDRAFCYEPKRKILPPAAGLVVRKQAWLQAVPAELVLNHKGREAGLASEDLEANLYIQQSGWEVWYNPQMHVYHHIPQWRLERDYLISLMRCVGLSRHHIRMMRLEFWQKPLAVLAYFMMDLVKLIRHRHRYPNLRKQSAIVAGEREYLISSLISPFFLWKLQYLPKNNLWTLRLPFPRLMGQIAYPKFWKACEVKLLQSKLPGKLL